MRRTNLTVAVFAAIAGLAPPASADICELTGKASAQNAVRMLSEVDVLLRYCPTCGQATPVSVHVGKTEAVPLADDPQYYQVRIDGNVVDVGYLYFLKPGSVKTWVNLGVMSGCSGASAVDMVELPADLAEKALAVR